MDKKVYDLHALQDLFNHTISPEELRNELAELMFNYASLIGDGDTPFFKRDVDTLSVLYRALAGVK